jgi:hypothetical protein
MNGCDLCQYIRNTNSNMPLMMVSSEAILALIDLPEDPDLFFRAAIETANREKAPSARTPFESGNNSLIVSRLKFSF